MRLIPVPEPPAGAIDRALAVLGVLAESSQPLGITEIARRLGLSKSVVHYHVGVLVRNRYLESRPDRRYGLGYAALRLGRGNFSNLEIRMLALPHLRALHHDTWETAAISVLVGHELVCVDQIVSPHESGLRTDVGRPLPLHAGAAGRAVLAFMTEADREAVLARPLSRFTPDTMVDANDVRAALAGVLTSGVAISRGERREGAAAIAAPVFDGHGVAAAISLLGPGHRVDSAAVERYRPLVKAAAAQLSRELGA